MDGGAWHAAAHGVTKNQTQLRIHACAVRPRESKTMVKPSWNPGAIEKPEVLQRDLTPGLGSRPKSKFRLDVCTHSDSSSRVALTAFLHCWIPGPGNQGSCLHSTEECRQFTATCNTLQVLAPSSLFTVCVCVCVCVCMLHSFSCVWLFETLWTIAHQSPLSMGFSRQKYWSGLSCPSPGDLPDPRDWTWVSCTAGKFFNNWPTREASSC